jgi:hypothetical protein
MWLSKSPGRDEQIVIAQPYLCEPPLDLYQYRWFTRPALRGTSSMHRGRVALIATCSA